MWKCRQYSLCRTPIWDWILGVVDSDALLDGESRLEVFILWKFSSNDCTRHGERCVFPESRERYLRSSSLVSPKSQF